MRSWRRWTRVLLVAFLALLGLRAALPLLVEIALERVLSGALAARLEIGDVDLDFRKAEVIVENATLRAASTGMELAHAARLELDADWGALVEGRLEAERALLDEPRLLLAFDERGDFNWADVLGAASAPSPAREESAAESFRVRIARAEVVDGGFDLSDRSPDALPSVRIGIGGIAVEGLEVERPERGAALQWGIDSAEAHTWQVGIAPQRGDPLEFQMSAGAAALDPEGLLPIELELKREGGGRIAVQGHLRPQPLELSLHGSWEDIHSKALLPFLQVVGGLRVERGKSSGALDVALTLDEVPERGLTLNGRASHRDLALSIEGDAPTALGVARIDLELERLRVPIPSVASDDPEPIVAHWGRIEITEPVLEITLPEVDAGAEPEAGADSRASPKKIDVRVDALSVRGGRATWRDRELGPDHQQSLAPIALEATDLRWPRTGFRRLLLEVGGVAAEPVRLEGSWVGSRADAELRATRVALAPWDPVIRYYTDYSVSRGTLSLRSHFRLRGEAYEAPTRVTLHHLEARSEGNAFQRTFGVPLARALPLLKDPAGRIELDVPVHGTLSEGARVDLVPAVAEALRASVGNALANAGALPTDVAGTLLRRVGEIAFLGVGEAAFDAGEYGLGLDARLALDAAAGIARQTPGARIELVSEVVSDDLAALGVSSGENDILGSVAALGRALVGGGREVEGETHARLAELAELRFAAIETYLREQSGLGATRILRRPWDGKVREGPPRVLLRLQIRG